MLNPPVLSLNMPDYIVGVDVGGTNTDAVLLDPSKFLSSNIDSVVSWNKSTTTRDVAHGIENTIEQLFQNASEVDKKDIKLVTIGTTHFINAIVEQDSTKLEKVAVLRICGPYSRELPTMADFPPQLKNVLFGYFGYCQGGHMIDKQPVDEVNEKEIVEHCLKIQKLGIKSIAVVATFSPVINDHEVKVLEIIERNFPDWKDLDIILSHSLSGLGFLERENLTILNAAIKKFAFQILSAFHFAVTKVGLVNSSLLITQNDGTLLTLEEALAIPIKTFASGATNSMRGASFLCNANGVVSGGEPIIVVDVGGTTTDVGMLLADGFPKHTSSHSYIGGVRTQLSMPEIQSIGLGGGSIISIDRENPSKIKSIGPESVGSQITEKAIVFGGDTYTTTDFTLANMNESTIKKSTNPIVVQADISKVNDTLKSTQISSSYASLLKSQLEKVIDKMKVSPDPIKILLVGGGSFIVPDDIQLDGCSEIIKPPYYGVANAIGAAIGKISSTVVEMASINGLDAAAKKDKLNEVKQKAIDDIVEKGAIRETVSIVNVVNEAIPYVSNLFHIEVKVIGDVDYSATTSPSGSIPNNLLDTDLVIEQRDRSFLKESKLNTSDDLPMDIDIRTYRPNVRDREWLVSEMDLEFIRIGTYILGCGGGGDPYTKALQAKEMVKSGHVMKIIDIKDVPRFVDRLEDIKTVPVAACGSPTVTTEQLQGYEVLDAFKTLQKHSNMKPSTILSLEIGGANGLQGLLLGGLPEYNLRVIDADLMGRAYPLIWQVSPVALKQFKSEGSENNPFFSPSCISDGNGNNVYLSKVRSDHHAENIIRSALSEMGSYVGLACSPMNYHDLQHVTIPNSLSLAWRIGRGVCLSKQDHNPSQLPKYICDSIGDNSGKLLCYGKIVGIEKKLHKGFVFGELIIQSEEPHDIGRRILIPFQNENLYIKYEDTPENEVIASVPDLISVIDAESGEAIGTPDYRYGLHCFVLLLRPSTSWTKCKEALEVGGPKAFGLDIEYVPTLEGQSLDPTSVIDEYSN